MNVKKICAAVAATVLAAGSVSYLPSSVFERSEAMEAVFVSDNFDTTYDGWMTVGERTVIEADETTAHNSMRGMHVTNRMSSSDGAASMKGFYIGGGQKYDYKMYVYHESAEDEVFTLKLDYMCEDGVTTGSEVLAVQSVKAGEWTEITSSCKAPAGAYDLTVTVTTDTENDFWMDDFTVSGKKLKDLASVSAASGGLKDEFANYFRVGNILNGNTVKNSSITSMYLKDFNAIECENETKPDAMLRNMAGQCTDTNIKVSLNSCAAIADFCSKNGLGFRGHTLVWHSQTPDWFFKTGFSSNGNWVSKSVMNQRLESYIKNVFGTFKSQYPNLNLYAFDVANECMNDQNGGPRQGGYGNGASPWTQIYGDNSFIEQAFKYARQYAPEGCDLYYNDYNEYMANGKKQAIMALAKDLYGKGLLDGVGMQSHVPANATGFAGTEDYLKAMDDYLAIGCDVQVTELDISLENGKYSLQDQANKYKAIFQHAVEHNKSNKAGYGKVTLVQVWGPNDANSWLSSGSNALLYDSNNQPKAAYNTLINLLPSSEWGDGSNPATGGGSSAPLEPDQNGYWFHDTFEDGAGDWTARGGCTLELSGRQPYAGSEALLAEEREDAWNGAQKSLSSRIFKPGEEYAFSACFLNLDGDDETEFKLTLQYTDGSGEAAYDKIAQETTARGEWVQLYNPNYKIPSDATDLVLVVETTESTSNFYVDEIIAAAAGTKISGPSAVKTTSMAGDLDFDEKITIADMVLLKSGLIEGFTSTAAEKNGDVDKSRKTDSADALLLKEYLLGIITEFPKAQVSVDTTKLDSVFSGMSLADSFKKESENNPLFTQRFGADPGWMVYNDRLYVYTTNDAFEYKNGQMQENSYDVRTLNCLSTADLVNWTDHGAIPVAGNGAGSAPNGAQWASKWASRSWAPDACWKNINGQDKFFLYFANNGSGIGVLTADTPVGPWKDPIGKELISRNTPNCGNVTWLFDPGVYYDEKTGKGYLAFGGGVPDGKASDPGTGRIVQLGDDMISIAGTPTTLNPPYLFEDSSLIKIGNEWIYSFCHNWNVPGGQQFSNADIGYMSASNPLGPYTYKGVAFKNTGSQRLDNGGNNHHSIIEFKGQYYVLYHSRQLEMRMGVNGGKGLNYRSPCIDKATVNNGSISCSGSQTGVSQIETLNPYEKVQAETMSNQSDNVTVNGLYDTTVSGKKGSWIKVSGVDFKNGAASVTARVSSSSGGAIKVATSRTGSAEAYIEVPAGSLQEVTFPVFGDLSGKKDVYFIFSGDIQFDYWFFE